MCWTNRTYDAKLDKLAELKAARDALESQIKDLETTIKEDLGDLEIKETGKYLVRYTHYETSRFDSKAFGKKHPKLLEEFTKKTAARRFTFTARA